MNIACARQGCWHRDEYPKLNALAPAREASWARSVPMRTTARNAARTLPAWATARGGEKEGGAGRHHRLMDAAQRREALSIHCDILVVISSDTVLVVELVDVSCTTHRQVRVVIVKQWEA